MFISSGILSIFGTYHVYYVTVNGLWNGNYIFSSDEFTTRFLVFFMAANMMDLLLGFAFYPKFMDPLSTTFHHIFYFFFVLTLIQVGYSCGFCLTYFMEVPTFVLSVGSMFPEYRSDVLFGVSFFVTRILFLIVLLGFIYTEKIYPLFVVSTCVLGMHIYWFSKWIKSYSKRMKIKEA